MIERVKGAQVAVMMVTIYTLVLAALLTERRSREEGLRRLLEALPAAIQTRDTAGRITYCNQAAVDLWGKRPVFGKTRGTIFTASSIRTARRCRTISNLARFRMTERRKVRGPRKRILRASRRQAYPDHPLSFASFR